MYDLVLRGGTLLDGSGAAAVANDIAIAGERIVALGSLPSSAEARDTLNVAGLTVTPGLIDMHSHSDVAAIAEPSAPYKVGQGITLEVLGQDGLGVAPYDPVTDDTYRRALLGLTGHPEHAWNWGSFGEYLEALEAARPAVNLAVLVGFGTVRN